MRRAAHRRFIPGMAYPERINLSRLNGENIGRRRASSAKANWHIASDVEEGAGLEHDVMSDTTIALQTGFVLR